MILRFQYFDVTFFYEGDDEINFNRTCERLLKEIATEKMSKGAYVGFGDAFFEVAERLATNGYRPVTILGFAVGDEETVWKRVMGDEFPKLLAHNENVHQLRRQRRRQRRRDEDEAK